VEPDRRATGRTLARGRDHGPRCANVVSEIPVGDVIPHRWRLAYERRRVRAMRGTVRWRPWVQAVIVGGALLLLGPPPAAPHPHMTVEYRLELLIGPGGPEGIRVTWIIDHYGSTELLDLFDADRNGVLSPAEVRRLEEHVRQEQGRSGFFTDITLNGESIPTPAPQSFGATVDQGQLTYQFVLPIRGQGPRAARSTSWSTIRPTSSRSRWRRTRRSRSPQPSRSSASAGWFRNACRTYETGSSARTRGVAGRSPSACRRGPLSPQTRRARAARAGVCTCGS
jgi:hypothetical protein